MLIIYAVSVILIFIFYFFLIAFFSFWRGKELQKSHSSLLKCFFPNWRFFEHLRPIPILYVRYQVNESPYSPWERVIPQRIRKLNSLFFNANGNYVLALFTAIENFTAICMETDENSDPMKSEEYKVINSLIQDFLKHKKITSGNYQFKILAETLKESEDVIVSPELKVQLP